jgi:hypothetical protein
MGFNSPPAKGTAMKSKIKANVRIPDFLPQAGICSSSASFKQTYWIPCGDGAHPGLLEGQIGL